MDTQARWILVLRACCCMGLQERRLGECVRYYLLSVSGYCLILYRKRVFLLGPSHHYYLSGAATTGCDKYATPLGDLIVDTGLVKEIQQEWDLEIMSRSVDEEEHSLEMHLPYICKMLSL
jgi:AmmeMemoRadiSam system protein B